MKKILIPLLILALLIGATIIVIFFGNGYRFLFDKGRPDISGTGLLVAKSTPDGAQVFVNNHLTTATDNTINLAPGKYEIKIFKEGYFPWQKHLRIEKGVVTKAEALLFPVAPKLESMTNSGVANPVLDPSLTRVAYTVSSQSARKNGIYVLDMSSKPILTLQSSSTQIADDTINSFSKAKLSWSPDGSTILATISAQGSTTTYQLLGNTFNQSPSDVTETIASVNSAWQKQKSEKDKARLDSLSTKLKKIVAGNFKIIAWSSDETKILYEASSSAVLPAVINPPLIGTNSTPEQRSLKIGAIYVYDIKEDKNFKILDSLSGPELPLGWFPDSKHLIYVHDQKIDIVEYDAGNDTQVYAGPFIDNYVFPWPDESRIVILTNLGNSDTPPNLYTIGLK